jgi:hypothetical protein
MNGVKVITKKNDIIDCGSQWVCSEIYVKKKELNIGWIFSKTILEILFDNNAD